MSLEDTMQELGGIMLKRQVLLYGSIHARISLYACMAFLYWPIGGSYGIVLPFLSACIVCGPDYILVAINNIINNVVIVDGINIANP